MKYSASIFQICLIFLFVVLSQSYSVLTNTAEPKKRATLFNRLKSPIVRSTNFINELTVEADERTPLIKKNKIFGVSKDLAIECMGEVVGTAILIGVGTAACACAITKGGADLGVAATWSWIIAAMIACLSHVSGAHFNPAISIANKIIRPDSMTWWKVLFFSVSQFLGASIGSFATLNLYAAPILAFEKRTGVIRSTATGHKSAAIVALFYPSPNLQLAVPGYPSILTATMMEIIGTGLLAFVAFSLGHGKNKIQDSSGSKPIIIGFTVGTIATIFGPITMAGLNPARDLGPRLVCLLSGWGSAVFPKGGFLGSIVVYTIGPIIGAIFGGTLAQFLGNDEKSHKI